MALRLKGCCDSCPPASYTACDYYNVFEIQIKWGSGTDLDVGVKYNNSTAGYSCENGTNPLYDSGDIRTEGGTETVFVTVTGNTSQNVDIFSHWYNGTASGKNPSSNSFNVLSVDIEIKVIGCDKQESVTVNTSKRANECSCSSSDRKVAEIAVNNGNWTLSKTEQDGGFSGGLLP